MQKLLDGVVYLLYTEIEILVRRSFDEKSINLYVSSCYGHLVLLKIN